MSETGFTEAEQRCSDALVACWNEFAQLPENHPQEKAEFAAAVHVLQGLLATRIVRRDYPAGWPTIVDDGGVTDVDVERWIRNDFDRRRAERNAGGS